MLEILQIDTSVLIKSWLGERSRSPMRGCWRYRTNRTNESEIFSLA
ncbi:MAG: hypothetical protein SAL07_23150 [Oscillatoria sp. PMC 1051.18]|nr:hypothetical protein [Oscillatoria salina]MBZ8179338.1 hypothetical protein [Oscillatoria salina IIICB1]MEC4894353.1 hypothetical protein [Oscillatoria sp. PMC 1050.18]MEC5032810.1 hypothetical protein [Oscillatoria sp. PMC 1051.18]NET87628.1 hypothetical protein [Kamptonema sp. SIO1D9]